MAPLPDPPPGGPRTIGKFRVVRKIGAGGMGVVYEVADPVLGPRAIKMLLSGGHDPLANQRFLDEALAMAAVRHINVVEILDYGEHDGQPYLVMPLLPGRNLEDALRDGFGDLPDALKMAADVARGLAAVHKRGLVHRDIKPANIWLEEDDGDEWRAKVMDFGIARDAPTPGQEATRSIGTPGYMALEQMLGTNVGPRADLFSLGVVLYRTLSGRFPYASPSIPLYYEALKGDRATPLHALNAQIPRPVSDLVARLIRTSADDRPADAKEVADLLAGFVAGGTGSHPPLDAAANAAGWEVVDPAAKPHPSPGRPSPPTADEPWYQAADAAVAAPPKVQPALARPLPPVAKPVSPPSPNTNANSQPSAETVPEYEKNRPDWLEDSRVVRRPPGLTPPRPSDGKRGHAPVGRRPRRDEESDDGPDDYDRPGTDGRIWIAVGAILIACLAVVVVILLR